MGHDQRHDRRKRSRNHRPGFELLESRRPLAGVTWDTGSPPPGFRAWVESGSLYLEGGPESDYVRIDDIRTRTTSPEVRNHGLRADERYFEILHEGDRLRRGWVLQADVTDAVVFHGHGSNDGFQLVETNRDPEPFKPLRVIAYGGDGDDILHGNELDDLLFGDDGDDFLVGDFGSDLLVGGRGDDRLFGDGFPRLVDDMTTDADYLIGGEGYDELQGDQGADWLNGGEFWSVTDEVIDDLRGYAGPDCFFVEWAVEARDYSPRRGDRLSNVDTDSIRDQSPDYHDWIASRLTQAPNRPINAAAYPDERLQLNDPVIRSSWPNLWRNGGQDFEILGPSTFQFDPFGRLQNRYNCEAYAVGIFRECSPFIETMSQADQYLRAHGYVPVGRDTAVDSTLEKVAVYAKPFVDTQGRSQLRVTHFARQSPDGTWISKFGPGPLIRHRDLSVLEGNTGPNSYGVFHLIYARPRRSSNCEPVIHHDRPASSADLNDNGRLDLGDLLLLGESILHGTLASPTTDLNQDERVDGSDQADWLRIAGIENLGRPYAAGDANLDGRFDSSDLVEVFQSGLYERSHAVDASWLSGDWNADGRFTSLDLVLAFQTGQYQ